MKYAESDEEARWKNYAEANTLFPDVRKAELERQLELVNVRAGERIVEVGTGSGILTYPMAEKVGPNGIVYSFDYRKENLIGAMKKNTSGLPIVFVPQQNNPQTGQYAFPLENASVDKISTIASFHHYDDRSLGTGNKGRLNALNEFHRILKNGGKIIIGDIANDTPTQRYFDNEADNSQSPAYCLPRGHPHDFIDESLARTLCTQAGFKNINFKIENVPFVFESESKMGEFYHLVHNSSCTHLESIDSVKRNLKTWDQDGKFYVEWNLSYLTAEK